MRKRLWSELPSKLHRLEVKHVSLWIGLAHCRRCAKQGHFQLLHHVGGDLVLDLEDVVELAVVGLRPQMRVGAGLDQLRGNPDGVARLAHRAFEHVGDVQRARDLRDLDFFAFEGERRRARRHL